MAISTTHTLIRYTGNSTVGPFAVDFQFLDAADLLVSVTTSGVTSVLVLGVGYTVTGGSGLTGAITMVATYTNATTILIQRRTAVIQPAELEPTGEFPPAMIERQLDRAICILQERTAIDVASCFRVTEDSDEPGAVDATNPANTLLGYDADGNFVLVDRDEVGTQGPQGFQGNQGFQGDQGFQGPQGTTGAQGYQGPQGVAGAQGTQGNQGFQGVQGFTGSQGSQGYQGVQGYQGNQGTQGIQGTQGNQGVAADAPLRLTSNYTTTSTANANTALTFSIGANEVWMVRCKLTLSAGAAGFKLQATTPVGATVEGHAKIGGTDTRITAINTLTTVTGSGSASNASVLVDLLIVNGSNAGTAALGAASVTGGQTTTIVAGSFMHRRKF